MPDAFQKKSDFEEEEIFTDYPQIVSLTEDIVYCPKCGTINSFNKSKSGRLLNHFCSRCDLLFNDLWNGYINGYIKSVRCFSCHEPTFDAKVYCIVCGAKQEKVRKERVEKIAHAKNKNHDLTSPKDESVETIEKMRIYFAKKGH